LQPHHRRLPGGASSYRAFRKGVQETPGRGPSARESDRDALLHVFELLGRQAGDVIGGPQQAGVVGPLDGIKPPALALAAEDPELLEQARGSENEPCLLSLRIPADRLVRGTQEVLLGAKERGTHAFL
jgi:hypothetical protein